MWSVISFTITAAEEFAEMVTFGVTTAYVTHATIA